MANIQSLDVSQHQNLKLKANPNFSQAKESHIAPLVVHEYAQAATTFPIVFIKDPQTGQFKSVAMMGLKPNENLFYSDSGWQGRYVPAAFKTAPLMLSQGEGDNLIVCIDRDSELLTEEAGDEREAFFDEKGERNAWVEEKAKSLLTLIEQNHVTQAFIQSLLDHELLTQRTLTVSLDSEQKYDLNGIYVIDEAKLNQLDDEAYLALKKKGYIAPIYAVLFSSQSIEQLAKLKRAQA